MDNPILNDGIGPPPDVWMVVEAHPKSDLLARLVRIEAKLDNRAAPEELVGAARMALQALGACVCDMSYCATCTLRKALEEFNADRT